MLAEWGSAAIARPRSPVCSRPSRSRPGAGSARRSSSCRPSGASTWCTAFDAERIGAQDPALPQVQVAGAGRLLPLRSRRDARAALRTRARRLARLPAALRSRPRFAPSDRDAIMDFDAIVVGSGISGGWVAKELCERGLQDAADRARPPRQSHDRLSGFRRALGSAESRQGAGGRSAPSTTPIQSPATRSTPRPSNGGCETASIRIRRPRIARSTGCAGITSVAGRSPGARQTYRLSDYRFQRQPARTATASTGRFATPTSRRGTTASNASPASPAATKDSSSCPTGSFLPPMDLNCVELASSRSIESNHPTRRVTIGPLRASDRAHGRTHRARARPLPAAQHL